jgi:membrane protein
MALLFWIYMSVYVLCLGGELNAEIEHQTLIDTTIGPERPLGRRGAFVADTIGKTAFD